MENLYKEFNERLSAEDKEQAVDIIVKRLKTIDSARGLVDLYESILKKALNEMVCPISEQKICIWKEHARSAIVRTILECAYPVVAKIKSNNFISSIGKAIVVCPDGENHEIGARMASDYFMLAGYDTIYVGASTPKEEFINAINEINPDVLAISVTNYYNIVSAKRTIEAVKKASDKPIYIVVGGNAFLNNKKTAIEIGADALLNTYEDIKSLKVEVR